MLQCPFTTIFLGKWNEKFPIIGLEPLPPVSSIPSHMPPCPSSPDLLCHKFTGLHSWFMFLLALFQVPRQAGHHRSSPTNIQQHPHPVQKSLWCPHQCSTSFPTWAKETSKAPWAQSSPHDKVAQKTCPKADPRVTHEGCLVPRCTGLRVGRGFVLNSGGFSALGCRAMIPVRVNHILW